MVFQRGAVTTNDTADDQEGYACTCGAAEEERTATDLVNEE